MYMPTHNYSYNAIKFTRDGGHHTKGLLLAKYYYLILDDI